jgi:single-stranded-DNA-specific exonuclease
MRRLLADLLDRLRPRRPVPSEPRRSIPSMAPPSRWSCSPYSVAAADELSRALEVSPVTAAILTRRGYHAPEAARHFLAADERHDPMSLPGVHEACEAILRHVASGSQIVVHGDYDVDGVCSTTILVRALRGLGAEPRWHIPARADGYGLSVETVERLAASGAGLLVTVDCAITATAEVARAKELGLEVVVTDHHRPAATPPDCPIVHPALGDYPFEELCAAAVAHKLAEAMYRIAGRDPAELAPDLDLVGLATVADVVPLRGENRALVRAGLAALARSQKPGLRALMRVSGVDQGAVTEHALGFRLAPRLNAAGRLQRADAALELLLTEDERRAADVADELDILNRERQDTETRILFEAEAARADHPEAPAYVLAGEGWHPGVIGIVASRMVERYHRPCVVIALDGDVGRGSGRSISAFDLHAGLAACSDHLARFGGHRAAAGLEIARGDVDAFRDAFVAHAASVLSPADLIAEQRIDAVVPGDALGTALAEELELLAPFGHGNPAPTLLVPAARVSDVRSMGEDGQHARFTLSGGGSRARAVAFRTAARLLPSSEDERHDVAVRLELNEWKGTVEPRLVLRAICDTERASCTLARPPEEFLEAFERALGGAAEPALAGGGSTAAAGGAAPSRTLRDRRGSGFAGVAGDLLSSGESVLVLCADVSRRRDGLESLVAGISARVRTTDGRPCDGLALASWDELVAAPEIAERFEHVVALDPPVWPGGEALLASLPGAGFAHLAWGQGEVEFALTVAQRSLDMRAELVALYKELRAASAPEPLAGERLAAVLAGSGAHPRPAAHAARLVRVLEEVGLVALEPGPALRMLDAHRTELERSPTYMRGLERYAMARAYLERATRAA